MIAVKFRISWIFLIGRCTFFVCGLHRLPCHLFYGQDFDIVAVANYCAAWPSQYQRLLKMQQWIPKHKLPELESHVNHRRLILGALKWRMRGKYFKKTDIFMESNVHNQTTHYDENCIELTEWAERISTCLILDTKCTVPTLGTGNKNE